MDFPIPSLVGILVIPMSVPLATLAAQEVGTSNRPLSADHPVEIASISEMVGDGEIRFTQGAEQSTLAMEVIDTVRVKFSEGRFCIFCVETIQIAPNLEVPAELFTLKGASELQGYEMAGGGMVITQKIDTTTVFDAEGKPTKMTVPGGPDSLFLASGIRSIPVPAEAVPCIAAGPQGATLRKEGRAFRLVRGQAQLVTRR